MVVTISLNDVLIFVFSVAGIALLIYLVIAIKNLNSLLKDVQHIFHKNKDNIDNTISLLPAIATNIKSITEEVSEGVQTIASTTDTIGKNIAKSSRKVTEKTEIAMDYVQILSELIKTGINYFSKRK